MAFGTGQHATTRTCLEEIEAAVRDGGVASALDVGTGSGILAAALARLGVPRVVALDVDPRRAAARAREPRPERRRRASRSSAAAAGGVRGRFDLVVANLLADTLVARGARRSRAVRRAGGPARPSRASSTTQVDARRRARFPAGALAATRADERWRTLRLGASG